MCIRDRCKASTHRTELKGRNINIITITPEATTTSFLTHFAFGRPDSFIPLLYRPNVNLSWKYIIEDCLSVLPFGAALNSGPEPGKNSSPILNHKFLFKKFY